jgi:hypothetical protein
MHALTVSARDPLDTADPPRYHEDEFFGVMIDSGAAKPSTAGYSQFKAYSAKTGVQLDTSTRGTITVRWGKGSSINLGSIHVPSPLGTITFHVMDSDTPFLLSLEDMDRLKVYYDNTTDWVIRRSSGKNQRVVPVIRHFGHAWIMGPENRGPASTMWCFYTEPELRRLHRRFGHPAADRLHRLLSQAEDSDVSLSALEKLTDYCAFCQKNSTSPGRFRFKISGQRYRVQLDHHH